MASRTPNPEGRNGRNPLTEADRARILELHSQGVSRNDIARETGRSGSTVTKVVHEAGLSFDRTDTAAATEARQADMAARRADALTREMDILEDVQTYVLAVGRGTRAHRRIMKIEMGGEETRSIDFLPSDDAQRLANARSSSVTIINRLTDTDAGEQAARGLLGKIADELGINDGPPA